MVDAPIGLADRHGQVRSVGDIIRGLREKGQQ
jgi:hypothetical protein